MVSLSANICSNMEQPTLKRLGALKAARLSVGIGCCSYDSFRRNYIYVLRKLGLIEPDLTVGEELIIRGPETARTFEMVSAARVRGENR